jgi:hypothetical protein
VIDRHYYIEYQGNAVELPLGVTIVGRDVGCKLRFNDPAVSRKHLRFIRRIDEVFVEDLKSSNGTKLNGRPITAPTRLDDGDAITVGGRTLFVRLTDGESIASTTVTLLGLPPVVDGPTARTRTSPHAAVTIPPEPRAAVRKEVAERRHDRHAIELPIVYVSSELEIEATSRDLSPSGVFVCSQVLDPIGTPCKLTFLVDGGPPLEITGIVRRVVERDENADLPGLGVEFSHVGDTERAWLEALIASLAK